MKAYSTLLLFLGLATLLSSCTDQCKETRLVRHTTPITVSLMELRKGIEVEPARELERPGKIYSKGKYLFINEIKEGIHIIDNSDPASPRPVSFVAIRGNGDLAVRGDILYADSYTDLVALDISDPARPKEVGRVKEVFPNGQFDGAWWSYNASTGAINDQRVELRTEVISTNCEETPTTWWGPWGGFFPIRSEAMAQSAAPGGGNTSGVGGSMARFTLYSNFLYAVSQTSLHLFDITTPAQPADYATIQVGWGIETIFPYRDKLFLGSTQGMYIFDNTNPAKPQQLSVFEHSRACDPVVVHNDVAYVTLRSGAACPNALNQLDLVDISNASRPQLIKSYPMQNPHGLSIDFPTLYLCEGKHGLKIFNVSDPFKVDTQLLAHLKDMDAYDVIALDRTLLLIGKDGLYQFDRTKASQLRLLSKIPVRSPQS